MPKIVKKIDSIEHTILSSPDPIVFMTTLMSSCIE